MAFTDHESISNAVKVEQYYKKVKESHPDFKVVRGNEIYLCRNGLTAENYNKEFDRYYHFILLAKDLVGFQQICEISTRAWTRSYMARGMRRVPAYYSDLFDILGKNPGHVIGSTSCLGGSLPTQLIRWRDGGETDSELFDKIKIWIEQIRKLFGDGNFFLEMQPSNNKDQIYVNKHLLEFSKEFNIPFIITTDSHYLKKEDRKIHKAFLNAQSGDREVDEFYATTYLMGTEELESYFSYFPEDILQKAYSNIQFILDSCENYSILRPLKIPSLPWKEFKSYSLEEWFKKIPMLEQFHNSEFEADRTLVNAVLDGIMSHSDLQNQKAYDEIDACLKDTWVSSQVNKAQWSAYFLNLQNIVSACWDAGTLVGPSRGSGGGFILLYTLGITQINPLREKTPTYRWRLTKRSKAS